MKGLGLTDKELDSIRGVFVKYPKIMRAAVFGSRAKGTHRRFSDIDIAIFSESLTHSEFSQLLLELDDLLLPYEMDVLEYEKIANQELRDHIDRVGVEIYAR